MRILCVQHLPLDDSVTLADWCRLRQHELSCCRMPLETLPCVDSYDLLVVLGGLMSAYDERRYPWLVDEKAFLRDAAVRGTPILGLCLGAQLLADALGGRTREYRTREVGWHEAVLTDAGRACPQFDLPDRFTPLQWHADNFDLPPDSVRLAESPACENQAFRWRDNVIACQFHVEYTARNIRELLAITANSLGTGKYVQTPSEICPGDRLLEERAEQLKTLYFRLLDGVATGFR